jgi:hypothetical protein
MFFCACLFVHAKVFLVFAQGSVAAQGTYSELQATGLDFVKLLSDDSDDAVEEKQPLQKMLRQVSVSVSIHYKLSKKDIL